MLRTAECTVKIYQIGIVVTRMFGHDEVQLAPETRHFRRISPSPALEVLKPIQYILLDSISPRCTTTRRLSESSP